MPSHSSRKRSSRRRGRRYTNKRARASERQALGGGHSHLVRPDRWDQRPQQPVVLDESEQACSTKPSAEKAKQRAAKKSGRRQKSKRSSYCPGREGNKRHHFMKEVREVTVYRYSRDQNGRIIWDWNKREPHVVQELYELCAYCPKERSRRLGGWTGW